MKNSLLIALLMYLVPAMATADSNSTSPLVIASVHDSYLSKQIRQQKLDERHYQAVLSESMRLLAMDLSLETDKENNKDKRPVINVDQPNLRGE